MMKHSFDTSKIRLRAVILGLKLRRHPMVT